MATVRANQPNGTTNWAAAIEGCLLVGIGTMLLRKRWDGDLPLYIHPRYTTLILVTGLVMLLIGLFRLWQTGSDAVSVPLNRRIGMYGLLAMPLLLGVLIPAKPAGSALVDPTQLNMARRGYTTPSALASDDSRKWTLFEWMFARYTLKPEDVQGKPVDVVGFVYHAPDQPANQFYVVRYTLACCVADRSGVSLPVTFAHASSLANDQWVQVTGAIESRPGNGAQELMVTNAQVTLVEQPAEPYLYP
jgi:uncharacterized repeat protein (TIGR03943 family)